MMVKDAEQIEPGDVIIGPEARSHLAGQNRGTVVEVKPFKRDVLSIGFTDGRVIRRQMDYQFEVSVGHGEMRS